MINITLIVTLVIGVGFQLLTFIIAGLLGTLGHYCLVHGAKADPHMSQVYLRHIRYQDFYPAQSSCYGKTAVIHPSMEV